MQLSPDTDLSPIFREIKKHNYKLAKILPVVPKRVPGIAEIVALINILLGRMPKRTYTFNEAYFQNLLQSMFRSRYPATYILFKALIKNEPISPEELERFFSEEELGVFVKQGLASRLDTGFIRFDIRIFRFMNKWFITDRFDRATPGMTYCGLESLIMVEVTRSIFLGRRKFKSCLDIGTGTGLQSICASDYCEKVGGIDINPRAVAYSKTNARINGLDDKLFRKSDLFSQVKEKYDLILSNPPYMFYPKEELEAEEHLDGDGGEYGVEIPGKILDNIDRFLKDDGVAVISAQSPVLKNRDMVREMVDAKFASLPYEVTLRPLCYFINPTHFFFYRKYGIRYNVIYLITLKKGKGTYKSSIIEMSMPKKLLEFLKIGAIYVVSYLHGKSIQKPKD